MNEKHVLRVAHAIEDALRKDPFMPDVARAAIKAMEESRFDLDSGPLTPDVYEGLLQHLGFASTRHVADFFGVRDTSARKWAQEGPTPPIEKMLRYMEAAGLTPEDVERAIGGRG